MDALFNFTFVIVHWLEEARDRFRSVCFVVQRQQRNASVIKNIKFALIHYITIITYKINWNGI